MAMAPSLGDPPLSLGDIQGLVLRGYSYYNIRHFIFKISDVDGARALCGLLCPGSGAPMTITTAEEWDETPPYCLNVGITNTGLKQLIGNANYTTVMNASLSLFSSFDLGAVAQAGVVGDTDTSAPQNWWPDAIGRPLPLTPDDLNLLVSLYTRSPADREQWAAALLAMIPAGADGKPAIVPAFVQDADPLPPPPGAFGSGIQIHFGYADGFSQPRIAGAPEKDLGCTDDSPIVPSWYFVIVESAPEGAPSSYNAHPLLVNGCFGAFRLLYQDVASFDAFLSRAPNPDLAAAKMCGRWLDGTPLEVSPDQPDPGLSECDLLNFGYLTPTPNQKGPRQSDDSGQYCPYAAHTRRANPRDDTYVTGNVTLDGQPLYSVQHRVRRFATPYGPAYTPETAGEPRGLVGLFMGANLTDQFEFLMQTWIGHGGFRDPYDHSPNSSGVDPLFGPQPSDQMPGDFDFDYRISPSNYQTVTPMTRFIVTKGGLYVFLPSITALHALAAGGLPS